MLHNSKTQLTRVTDQQKVAKKRLRIDSARLTVI